MFKTTLIATVFAATAFQAAAESSPCNDLTLLPADVAARVLQLQQYGDRFQPVIDAIYAEHSKPAAFSGEHEYDFSILTPENAERVKELMVYGDRFDRAIRAIFAEAVKPDWRFE